MRRILVTNDDGFRSEGIVALADALRSLGDVTVVAPMTEASAIGHALTLRRPLRLEHIAEKDNIKIFAVDGTPTHSANRPVTHGRRGRPDLDARGRNKGSKPGHDLTQP